MFADSDVKFDQPQTEVVFDRDKLRSQGVDLSQAGRDLSTMLGGNYVNRFSVQGRSYKVIPQIKRAERLTPEQLSEIYVTGAGGKLVPLSTFATLKTTTEPRELKRFQQLNAVHVQGVIPPGVSLDSALKVLEDEARRILPQGFTVDYAGESRQLRTEGSHFLPTFLLSAILIYLVLAAQFESFRDPFIILAGSVPLAISGALLFSFLGLTTLNIYSQVGLITLVGLVSKNGILIVEFANKVQEKGTGKLAAVIEAASTRLRPILMTTAATVMGHLPLVFARGPGAGARNSIGMMLVTGMIIGSAFTLFVVPSIYVLVAKTHRAEPAGETAAPENEESSGARGGGGLALPEPDDAREAAVGGEVGDVDAFSLDRAVRAGRRPAREGGSVREAHVAVARQGHAGHEDLHGLEVGEQVVEALGRAVGVAEDDVRRRAGRRAARAAAPRRARPRRAATRRRVRRRPAARRRPRRGRTRRAGSASPARARRGSSRSRKRGAGGGRSPAGFRRA